jgi:predicted house-cleaning noncanonical NTP pyrophosphatase (MazG superfamily)
MLLLRDMKHTLLMGKLVRDGIPEMIRRGGGSPSTRILEGSGYTDALFAKLLEEATEASAASAAGLCDELADCLEVLRAIAAASGVAWGAVEEAAVRKRQERGGFEARIWLE